MAALHAYAAPITRTVGTPRDLAWIPGSTAHVMHVIHNGWRRVWGGGVQAVDRGCGAVLIGQVPLTTN